MTDFAGNVLKCDKYPFQQVQLQFIHSMMTQNHDFITDHFDLLAALEANCHVRVGVVRVVSQIDSHPGGMHSNVMEPIDHLILAARWGIPPAHAKQTIQVTTQHGTRTMMPYARLYPQMISC